MKILAAIATFLFGALPVMADVTKSDIKKLLDAKVSDSVIVQYVKTNAPVKMSVDDLTTLKTAGASDTVLETLTQYMKVEKTVVYEYVYEPSYSYVYWYNWGYYYYPRYCYPRYYYVRRPIVVYRPVYRPVVVPRTRGGHR